MRCGRFPPLVDGVGASLLRIALPTAMKGKRGTRVPRAPMRKPGMRLSGGASFQFYRVEKLQCPKPCPRAA